MEHLGARQANAVKPSGNYTDCWPESPETFDNGVGGVLSSDYSTSPEINGTVYVVIPNTTLIGSFYVIGHAQKGLSCRTQVSSCPVMFAGRYSLGGFHVGAVLLRVGFCTLQGSTKKGLCKGSI